MRPAKEKQTVRPPVADRLAGVVFWAFRLLLGATFLYAGIAKASSSAQFAIALAPFTFLPSSWIGPLAVALPVIEVAGGALILLPWTKEIGAAALFMLCLIFAGVLGWALANDIIVACSCFGREETPSASKMGLAMARDVVLAAMAAAVFCEKWLRPLWRNRDSARKIPGNG